ncbi:ATP-dependent nuclease [Acidipropionibacterium virtanenii]|uniref:DNA replication and repair protein RecF n=1 Tax=Acidipropionibacterium virtanenii TaxID=2057246 RepID=A0A344UV39_9ACTN|nr:ATP-binding protein [Acidipropionibacterium virtanenii]AXE39137.1 DNA replication and repair protein RecF [Acidipropionibacterium virtanenii]
MRIRRLKIENFRGIKRLDWTLPPDQRLITLIGPGDSGKSTILEAIHLLLGDRWSVSFSDVDFYHVDLSASIQIKAILTDVPTSLLKDNTFGFWQRGLDDGGGLRQEPEDGLEPCLVVRLTVDESLEPQWEVVRGDGETRSITSSQRRAFSTFRVDDRTDAQLRWSRTSALGRMSAKDGTEREALAEAERAARAALNGHKSSAMNDLAKAIQNHANEVGGSSFNAIHAGLDSSRSGMGANLALYEDTVPLMAYGLGSRRLVSLAVQQMAAGDRAIAVIDELENGLEPHRAVRLLSYLDSDPYSQVFVTTHSPVVVEQAPIESLSVVQSASGEVNITSLRGAGDVMNALRRAAPSSLLARKVIIGEGKTEHGVLISCFEAWDRQRSSVGLTTAAGEGLAIQDGNGGEKAVNRAEAMAPLGCSVLALIDNDVRTADPHVIKAEQAGATVVRWEHGLCIEAQVCSRLDADELQDFISLGIECRGAESTVIDDLRAVCQAEVSSLNVQDWLRTNDIDMAEARNIVATAASHGKRGWFKSVDSGRALGGWLLARCGSPSLKAIVSRLDQIRTFAYGESLATEAVWAGTVDEQR